jgi:hypothetical protein
MVRTKAKSGTSSFCPNAVEEVPGVPADVFMALHFSGEMPKGEVKFDKAFETTKQDFVRTKMLASLSASHEQCC